jgi:hypothetical protein
LIYDTFTREGCGHGYDCCGCASTNVESVRRVGRHQWHIELRHSRNY